MDPINAIEAYRFVRQRIVSPETWAQKIGIVRNKQPTKIQKCLVEFSSYTSNIISGKEILSNPDDFGVISSDEILFTAKNTSFNPELVEKYGKEAPYGDISTGTNIVDKNVRQAFDLPDVKIFCKENTFDFRKIRQLIKARLSGGQEVDLVYYKTNVYSQNGHFNRHVDSPKSENMIGTLVICWGSKFKGGDLIINRKGERDNYNDKRVTLYWDKSSGSEGIISWTAFTGDSEHEVYYVTEGYRVTSTFHIILKKDDFPKIESSQVNFIDVINSSNDKFYSPKSNDELIPDPKATVAMKKTLSSLQNYLDKEVISENSDKKYVGLFTAHQYQMGSDVKGSDKLLVGALSRRYIFQIEDIISKIENVDYAVADCDGDREFSQNIYLFNGITDPIFDKKVHGKDLPSNIIFHSSTIDGDLIDSEDQRGGHAGNEIEPNRSVYTYLHRTIIISGLNENPEDLEVNIPIYDNSHGIERIHTFGWETWADQHDGENSEEEESSENENEKEESDEEE